MPYHMLPLLGFSTAAFETLWMLVWWPGIVRRTGLDILFCAGNSDAIVAVILKLLLGRGCPPIVAQPSNDLARPDMIQPIRLFYHLWGRLQGRMIDQFVALSAGMRVEAAGIFGVRPTRIRVIPDPILTDREAADLAAAGDAARRTARDGQGCRHLAIGRLALQKDFGLPLRAFRRGRSAEDRLVVLGEGRERRRLETLVRTLGLGNRVLLRGHTSRIQDGIRSSDIFLLSSRYEGLPAALVEAMADVLTDGRRHRLVPPGDETSLANTIATSRPLCAPADAGVTQQLQRAPIARTYLSLFGRSGAGAAPRRIERAVSPI